MDQKPKARSAKKKAVPKKKTPDEKQFERFITTARELGVDETGEMFDQAFEALVKRRSSTKGST